jgi:hypothetical protein
MNPHEMNPNDQNLHPALLLRSLEELKMPLTVPMMLVRVAIWHLRTQTYIPIIRNSEFAFEIGSGLLTEVRRLQSLLAERDKAIQDMKEEKDDLEKSLESLRGALKLQEQSTGWSYCCFDSHFSLSSRQTNTKRRIGISRSTCKTFGVSFQIRRALFNASKVKTSVLLVSSTKPARLLINTKMKPSG